MQFPIFATLALATLVAAAPSGQPSNQCKNGSVQCCNTVEHAGGASASKLIAGLGVVVEDLNVPIGINCSPINVLAAGGNTCSSQSVCCQDNSFNGVIAIGCVALNVNL